MADKILGIVGLVALVCMLMGVIFFIAQPLVWSENYAEWVIYARCFLLLSLIGTFAQLRLFNAIVKNSLFLIKLRDSVYKLTEKFPMLDRGIKSLNVTLVSHKGSVDALKKAVDTESDSTKELSERINNIRSNQKRVRK